MYIYIYIYIYHLLYSLMQTYGNGVNNHVAVSKLQFVDKQCSGLQVK